MINLPEAIRLNSARMGDKVAIIDENKRLTYSILNERVNRLCHAIQSLGLTKGDKVSILLYNCSEYMEIYVSLSKLGLVAVPINFRLVGREIEYVINQSDSKALFVGEEFLTHVAEIRKNFNLIEERIVVVGENKGQFFNYEELLTAASVSEPEAHVEPSDYEMIIYTSGTTGFPKGAVKSQNGMMWWYFGTICEYGITTEDIYVCVGPIFHGSFGTFAKVQLFVGGTVFITKKFDPEISLKTIEEERVTWGFFVPTMYNSMLEVIDNRKHVDLSTIKTLLSSGSALLTNTKEGILSQFANAGLYEFYGWTEVGGITALRPQDQLRKIRCVGKPSLGAELKIMDADGNEVPPGEIGEIYANHPGRFECYYNKPKETEAVFRGEFLTGGDMGKFDEEGYLYIVDRKNDMIVSGGENVYPIEIDEVLSQHPKIAEVAVIGVPDQKWGEAVKAVVVLKENQCASYEEIIQFCEGKLARYKLPKSIDFIQSLPRNPMGKILKRELRNQFWSGQEFKV